MVEHDARRICCANYQFKPVITAVAFVIGETRGRDTQWH
jgi:hypothetical protein